MLRFRIRISDPARVFIHKEKEMSDIRFARVFGDGAVLQKDKEIRVWGWSAPGAKVKVSLAGSPVECTADDSGRFDARFPAMGAGGPYTLTATDESGNTVKSCNIMIGDVIVICGQSNMEFPMARVRETYPHEWDSPGDDLIRTFKVTENGLFGKSIPDVETGQWKSFAADTIDEYSAVGYFTAKHLRLKEDVAVGIVDLTLGGAPIEAFMSEESLEGFDAALAEAEKFSDDTYRKKILSDNETNANEWKKALDKNDAGIGKYEDGSQIIEKGREVVFPAFFSDTELAGYTGSVWIARTFSVPVEYAKKSATLWFGTLVDFDSCYINGTFVGMTEYTYPPRRYPIPEGLIGPGDNTIVLRVGIEKGFGRITPGKIYGIVYGDDITRVTDGFNERLEGAQYIEYLGGVWKYLAGNKCAPTKDTVFVNWKPTTLYNGMLAPLSGLAVKAFAYYQGESNCQNNHEYPELTKRFIKQLREMWGEDLPYICVQLPEFDARMEEVSYDHGEAWRGLMAAQESCTGLPGFYLVRSYGTGELNDLHPQRKEPIGEKIAGAIASIR